MEEIENRFVDFTCSSFGTFLQPAYIACILRVNKNGIVKAVQFKFQNYLTNVTPFLSHTKECDLHDDNRSNG